MDLPLPVRGEKPEDLGAGLRPIRAAVADLDHVDRRLVRRERLPQLTVRPVVEVDLLPTGEGVEGLQRLDVQRPRTIGSPRALDGGPVRGREAPPGLRLKIGIVVVDLAVAGNEMGERHAAPLLQTGEQEVGDLTVALR